MTDRRIRHAIHRAVRRGLGAWAPLAAMLGLAATAHAGVVRHPRGLYGQDETLRSIRALENDADRLWLTFEAHDESWAWRVSLRNALREFEELTDALRDDYRSLDRPELERRVRQVLTWDRRLADAYRDLEAPDVLEAPAAQVRFDLQRLEAELGFSDPERRGNVAQLEGLDRMRLAVVEVEDLSDNLKRHVLRAELDPPEIDERQVAKKDGERRYEVIRTRLQMAAVEFEHAADELKRAFRRRRGPGDVRKTMRTLARTGRVIDHSMPDVAVDEEARREWRELLPPLRMLLDAHRPTRR